MSEHTEPPFQSNGALDALITQLVACGGVLSQILAHMAESVATGASAPDAPPPDVVLHELLRGVLTTVADRHPASEIEMASALLDEITETICGEVLLVDPRSKGGRRPRSAARRKRPRRG